MRTRLDINRKLVALAKNLGKHKTETEAVNAALALYVQRREQARITEAFGTVDYYDDYDYKALRRKR